ncbi:hypothetical protein CCYA_CCYA11G3103 [Cyanidiococcus yangmingshanensis]|nr:hypothetical protein CCYA_CCYA11G3103 [Cyanidiococcus yangmingshanensis]
MWRGGVCRLSGTLFSVLRGVKLPSLEKAASVQATTRRFLVPQRNYSPTLGSFGTRRQLYRLEREADSHPEDWRRQLLFLEQLNREGSLQSAEKVIQRFESGQYALGEGAELEYLKALVRVGKLEERTNAAGGLEALLRKGAAATNPHSRVFGGVETSRKYRVTGETSSLGRFAEDANLQAGAYSTESPFHAPRNAAVPSSPRTFLGGTLSGGTGSSEEPLVVTLAEPTFRTQIWKTIRTLGTVFLLMSGIGAVMEERGLARGISMQQEVLPEEGNKNLRRFSDVKGCDEAKDELIEIVEYLKAPQKFTRLGGKLPKGVLLVGPPGTGKTLLARAIAGEAGVPFFYASGSEFEEMFVGVGARRVRELFNAAKKRAPCIVFIDEIDAIGGKRNPKDQMYMKMTLNQLLVELDGFSSAEGIIVIGATNFPESLDKALIRPGRFDRHVIVPNPDVRGREEILSLHTEKIPLADDVNLEILARSTPGFSGAELANLVNMAALKAAREGASIVTMENFEFAKDKIIMGAERRSAVISEDNRRLTAYHESGHALVALFTEGAFPVHKATIVPRGIALGMVAQLPDKDMTSMSRKQMLAKLDVCMGGRAAEELIFGSENVTNGAESDFQQATELAEAMVTRFGMSQEVGHMVYDTQRDVCGDMLHVVEKEVKQFLDESYQRAKQVLLTHEKELHRLAAALLERETLSGEEVARIVKGDRLVDKRTQEASLEPEEAGLSDSGSLAENVAARARGAVAAAAAKAGVSRPAKVPAAAKTA